MSNFQFPILTDLKSAIGKLVLVAAIFLCWTNAFTQNFPVQANLAITPPYSVYLQDYISPGFDRMSLNLLLRDLTAGDVNVKLKVFIIGQGVNITTDPNWRPEPLILSAGVPERFTGYDLSEYFNPDHLQFEGLTKREFLQTGSLPEGVYRFCVEVIEYNRNVKVSNTACYTAWLILNDPPIVNVPANGIKIRATEPQNVIFQWTPRHTGSPNSAFRTEYEFRLVEIWPEGRNPNDAILSTNSIFETTTQSTTLVYGIAEPPLIPGRTYAFRVRAKSIVGVDELDLFKNNGYSETVMFIYGDECMAPTGLAGRSISAKRLATSWESAFNHTTFNVQYREKADDAAWFDEETLISDKNISGLKPNTQYEIQVQAECGTLTSPYSEMITLRTDEDRYDEFACGVPPGTFALDNTQPLETLVVGDYIYVNDFDVKIDSISGGNGVFTGTGVAEMPFLSLVKVRVRFDNISVNTDYRMIDGQVFTIYNPESKNVVDLDDDDDITEGEGDDNSDEEGDNEFNDGDIVVDGEVDSVYVNDDGDIVVVGEDGSETTYDPAEDEGGNPDDTVITDGSGDTWTVDKDGNVTSGSGNGGDTPDGTTETDSVLFVQKELIKEVLQHYKEEINLWMENNGKGPLDEALVRRLMAMPDCLPEDEEGLEAVLAKIEEYLEDPETLLSMVKEGDADKTRIEELTAKLTGNQPPYAAGLSETEWDELLEMVCPYLLPEEEDQVQYTLPLTVYLDDDYYLIDPDKTEFSKGDTITVESYMAGATLFMKDAEGKSVELLSSHFPDNAGQVWPPGFTVDIEELEEGEIEEVKILIPEVDTLLVYIEKYKPALEMGQSDILALLSDINEAQKDDKTVCDLSARLADYNEGDISGDLGKVKVNGKYEVQSLKLTLTNQDNTEISLEDVDITIKEGADKDKEIAVFTFTGTADGETVMELTVEKKDREFLEWYLLGEKPVFKITTTHVTDDDYATVSSFTINRGDFSGYFLERPEGTATQERTAGSYKRIPEGDYKMCYTYKQCRAATTRSNADNETWVKTYGETDDTGATITREYVLIHIGNYPWNSAGCLLIGSGYSDHTLSEDYFENETGITYEKDLVVKKVTSSGDKLTALNNEYKKLIDLAKKFDDDCENNKCYELEIDINR